MSGEEFEGESSNVESGTPPMRRTIVVRKRKTVAGGGGGGVSAIDSCGGIGKFDEYIQKSGLDPKAYQREGVEFCLRHEDRRRYSQQKKQPQPTHDDDDDTATAAVLGGIIADEMGLGKTIVMMGLIIANLAVYRRTLIVVPVALIAQWVAQIKKTIIDTGVKPDLSILVYHGSTGKRRVVLSNGESSSVWCHRPPKRGGGGGGGGAIDVVITTYGCVAMEEPIIVRRKGVSSVSAVKTPSLLTFRADRVIFDEAHHLRNKSSRVFKGAMRVVGGDAADGRSVWIVTGTPIQNKISDLKSLCYILGFKVSELITEERRKFIRDNYVLRRTKVSVGMVAAEAEAGAEAEAEAGEDTASMTYCMPSSSSRLQSLAHYRTNVPWTSQNELDLSLEIHQKAKNTTDRAERLKLYTQMRQMCVWPALLRRSGGGGSEGLDDSIISQYGLSIDEFHVAVSKQSKMDRVVATMTAEVTSAPDGERRKSIVFCHYRREMTQLRDMLLMHGGGGGGYEEDDVAIIDGSVGPRQRAHIFASAPSVLILQIRTCSEGLNLQEYSNVYFISPHWNPCVEDQAIARCYRMGQTSQVRVFRFYMADFVGEFDAVIPGESECISTLDHRCEEIQEKKRILCNEFLLG
jgi:SNF2 family DNA or RNA helicase